MAAQASLCVAWLETPEDTFCRVVAHFWLYRYIITKLPVHLFVMMKSPEHVLIRILKLPSTTWPICNDEIAGTCPHMNIKVAVYDMTYLQDNTIRKIRSDTDFFGFWSGLSLNALNMGISVKRIDQPALKIGNGPVQSFSNMVTLWFLHFPNLPDQTHAHIVRKLMFIPPAFMLRGI